MKNCISAMVKPLALSIAAIAIFTLGQGVARADEVTIAGNTLGCFGVGCTPVSSSTLLGLTYNNSTFGGTTSNGFLGIGNNATPPGNVDNLGSFTLDGSNNVYTGNTFTLQVTFTVPTGIIGPNSQTFVANLIGSVTTVDQGGVFVDFVDNSPRIFSFSNASGTGSFTFSVNDVTVQAGRTIALSGNIVGAQQTAIPEPATMLLLGTGLAGVAAGARRRRAKK